MKISTESTRVRMTLAVGDLTFQRADVFGERNWIVESIFKFFDLLLQRIHKRWRRGDKAA